MSTQSYDLDQRETVRTQTDLASLCADLRSAGRFALDTEFMGERSYVPKLCLIQVATTEFVALIDTLPVSDLGPFWALVQDPGTEKVLHAAREDLRLAFYGGGRQLPRSVIDTQVASGLVGLPQYPLSYQKLVAAVTGVQLSKAETRSDWDRRPLSPDQLRYARDDVRYLLPIADKLPGLLRRLGRDSWLRQEMERFEEPLTYEPDPEAAYLRIRGSRSGLTARPTAMMRSVAAWREREAAYRDIPARAMLKDEAILELVQRSPRRLTDFARLRFFPAGEEAEIGPGILEALESARSLPETDLPAPLAGGDDETPEQRVMTDLFYALASAKCLEANIAPEFAVTRTTASDLVLGKSTASLLSGWRSEVFGGALAQLGAGAGSATVTVVDKVPKVVIK